MIKLAEVPVEARDRNNETPVATCLCGRFTYTWSCPLRIVDVDSGAVCCPWCAFPQFADVDATGALVARYKLVPGALGLLFRVDELLRTQRQQAATRAAHEAWAKANPGEVARLRQMREREEAEKADWIAHADEHKREDEIERMMRRAMPNLLKSSAR